MLVDRNLACETGICLATGRVRRLKQGHDERASTRVEGSVTEGVVRVVLSTCRLPALAIRREFALVSLKSANVEEGRSLSVIP